MPERRALLATGYVKTGKLWIARREGFEEQVSGWENGNVIVRVEQDEQAISTALRAYYWVCPIHLVSEETGETPFEAHERMKQMHYPTKVAALRGLGRISDREHKVKGASIMNLSNPEMLLYIENIRIWAAGEPLLLFIPDPVKSNVLV